MAVFVRGTDKALWSNSCNIKTNTWSGFVSRGGKLSSSPSAVRYAHTGLGGQYPKGATPIDRDFRIGTAKPGNTLYAFHRDGAVAVMRYDSGQKL